MKQYTLSSIHNSAAGRQLIDLAETIHQKGISAEALRAYLLRDNALCNAILSQTPSGHQNSSSGVKPATDDQVVLGTAEVAAMFGVKPQTLRKWVCYDKLPEGFPRPCKIKGKSKWRVGDINAYFANLTNEV